MRAKLVFLGVIFASLGLSAQLTTSGLSTSGSASSAKDFGNVVKKGHVVRVVDQELGNVCYIAHGVSNDSGASISCMKLEKQ